jgi:hypothetical protein
MSLAHIGKPSWNKGRKFPQFSGKNNVNWNGGRPVTESGYVLFYCPDHPKPKFGSYVYEHRLVMEKHLGRYLKPSEIVHHKNQIKTDNRVENLQLFKSHREHSAFHNKQKKGKNNGNHNGKSGDFAGRNKPDGGKSE